MNQTQDDAASNRLKMSRLRSEATTLKRLYCPCPGFAYNSLAGDKTVLVGLSFLRQCMMAHNIVQAPPRSADRLEDGTGD